METCFVCSNAITNEPCTVQFGGETRTCHQTCLDTAVAAMRNMVAKQIPGLMQTVVSGMASGMSLVDAYQPPQDVSDV